MDNYNKLINPGDLIVSKKELSVCDRSNEVIRLIYKEIFDSTNIEHVLDECSASVTSTMISLVSARVIPSGSSMIYLGVCPDIAYFSSNKKDNTKKQIHQVFFNNSVHGVIQNEEWLYRTFDLVLNI